MDPSTPNRPANLISWRWFTFIAILSSVLAPMQCQPHSIESDSPLPIKEDHLRHQAVEQKDSLSPARGKCQSKRNGYMLQSLSVINKETEVQPTILAPDDVSRQLDQTRDSLSLEVVDTRVPFWNIAHMINSIKQVDAALCAGANGIEADISFDVNGYPKEVFHGIPCDCGRYCMYREDLIKFVKHLAQITNPPASSRLLIVLFDLKLKGLRNAQKVTAGRHLAELLHKHIYAPYQSATLDQRQNGPVQPPLRVVISINHASDFVLVKSFINYVKENGLYFMIEHVGFDVGMNDNLKKISNAWGALQGATVNIWQGDGLTNCLNLFRTTTRLQQAISMRNDQDHFRKVYFWTADIKSHIRGILRLDLDAMLTNRPERLNQVLDEREFRTKYRLANPHDDPFQQIISRPSPLQSDSGSMSLLKPSISSTESSSTRILQPVAETLDDIQESSSNFIETLPDEISPQTMKQPTPVDFLHEEIISV